MNGITNVWLFHSYLDEATKINIQFLIKLVSSMFYIVEVEGKSILSLNQQQKRISESVPLIVIVKFQMHVFFF